MVLSTRVSLQWVPETPEELTNTMVFTSKQDFFVDVRIYKHKYPYHQSGNIPENFDDVFQWVIVGKEEELKDTNKIRFNHSINSQEIARSLASGKPVSECRNEPDVGAFWPIGGSEDRKETGEMAHPETGKITEYVEIWRSLNPNSTSVSNEVREGYDQSGSVSQAAADPVMTFDLKKDGFIGRIVRLGNWAQGVVYEERETPAPISVMRAFWDADEGVWKELIKYGKHSFPEIYKQEVGAKVEGSWHRIE